MQSVHRPTARRLLLAATCAAVLAGCAGTPQIEGQWTAPNRPTMRLAGAKVLVACEAVSLGVKDILQKDRAPLALPRPGTSSPFAFV